MVNKKVLGAVVLIAIIAIGGYFVLKTKNNEPAKVPPVVVDETANWETYKNDQYGIEFKYPALFSKDTHDEGGRFLVSLNNWGGESNHNDRIDVSVIPSKDTSSFQEYTAKYPITDPNSGKPFQFKTRILGSNTFYYTRTERFEGVLSFAYYVMHNNMLYGFFSDSRIVDWTAPDFDEENDSAHVYLRQILSTLKFTK